MTLETLSGAIDAHFSAAAQPGPVRMESPLAALGLFSVLCRWNPDTKRIDCGDIEWLTMEALQRGQRNSPEFQELYRNTRNSLPSRWDFWLLVVRSSGVRRANMDEAQLRIAVQALNDPDTVLLAQTAWKNASLASDAELKKFFQIMAMYYLLLGQRHHADTMQLYRACFKDGPDELFRRVELITPLDLEDIAVDLESRRKASSV